MLILAFLGFTNAAHGLPVNDKLLHFFCLCLATGVFYFIFDVEEYVPTSLRLVSNVITMEMQRCTSHMVLAECAAHIHRGNLLLPRWNCQRVCAVVAPSKQMLPSMFLVIGITSSLA